MRAPPKNFPPEVVPVRAESLGDPYEAGPLPGKPLSMAGLNEDRRAGWCAGARAGRHRFGEDLVCERCGIPLKAFVDAGGIVLSGHSQT
jgi:hypothetical protein